jgi:hypothetical protein
MIDQETWGDVGQENVGNDQRFIGLWDTAEQQQKVHARVAVADP